MRFPKMPPMFPPDPAVGSQPPLASWIELDQLLTAMLLGVLALLGLLLLVGGPWLGYYAVHLWLPLWLLGCAMFGGARLSRRPDWLRRGLRLARGQFMQYGGGFYGAIALIAFGWLEWARLVELWAFVGSQPSTRDIVRHLFDFGIDAFMNGISAMAWPAFHAKVFEMRGFWQAFGISAGLFGATQGLMAWLPARARA